MSTAPIAQGPVDVNVREHIGYCPVCETHRPSLPAPAEGTCAYCYNHLMKPCEDCANYRATKGGEPVCAGSPRAETWTAWFARRSDDHCGASGTWAVFPNAATKEQS